MRHGLKHASYCTDKHEEKVSLNGWTSNKRNFMRELDPKCENNTERRTCQFEQFQGHFP